VINQQCRLHSTSGVSPSFFNQGITKAILEQRFSFKNEEWVVEESRMFVMKAIWFVLALKFMCLLFFSHFLFRNGPPGSSFHIAAI
jgi:hypothetical protein